MKTKNKPESDESILEHCICRDAAIRAAGGRLPNGKVYLGLEHDLGTALAKRDYKAAEKRLARDHAWGVWLHRAIQIGIAVYVYHNWDDLSPKMFLLLLGIFLWRSINRSFGEIAFLHNRWHRYDQVFGDDSCVGWRQRSRLRTTCHCHPQPKRSQLWAIEAATVLGSIARRSAVRKTR
jgi:hypothetical protein